MKVENHTTNLTEIKRIIREYYKQLYTNRLDSIDKMKKKIPRNTGTIKIDSRRNRKLEQIYYGWNFCVLPKFIW